MSGNIANFIEERSPRTLNNLVNTMNTGQKKAYLGKPQNQRDPNAILPKMQKTQDQPKVDKPQQPPVAAQPGLSKGGRQRRRLSLTINKPTAKTTAQQEIQQAGQMPQPTNVDSMRNSVFVVAMSNREVSLNIKISPSAPTIIDVSQATYAEMLADESHVNKTLLPEYLDYYATALLWFRFCTLKVKLKQPIIAEERDLLLMLEQQNFSIPEPLLLQLRVFGTTQTMTREHLYPVFPTLPTELIDNFGGYYGVLNANTHNLYEEIQCLGVLGEAVRHAISNEPPGPYASNLSTDDLTMNPNLLGYKNLGVN